MRKPNMYGQVEYRGSIFDHAHFMFEAQKEHINMHTLGLCPNHDIEMECGRIVRRRAEQMIKEAWLKIHPDAKIIVKDDE